MTLDYLKEVNNYGASRLIYTDINRDGMKQSPNFEETVKIANTSNCPVIISGGVSSIDDIKKAKELNNAFKKVGEDIGTGITDALVGAIEGTRSLGEAARSILNDIASSLLRIGINAALTGLFGGTKIGGFLGFANGGRPPVGKPSIVGERGPEIFVPRSAGTIIPNNQIGGAGGGIVNNINVNVSAEGMQSSANEDRGKELGVALASAIQSELIKQKRPGGLLAT